MPDSTWPPRHRTAGRILASLAYGSAAVAGVGVMLWPPRPVSDELSQWVASGLGTMVAVSALVCLVAVIRSDWHAEWIAVAFLCGGFAGYAAAEWYHVGAAGLFRLAGAAITTFAAAACGRQYVTLLVFSLRASTAKKVARRGRR